MVEMMRNICKVASVFKLNFNNTDAGRKWGISANTDIGYQ